MTLFILPAAAANVSPFARFNVPERARRTARKGRLQDRLPAETQDSRGVASSGRRPDPNEISPPKLTPRNRPNPSPLSGSEVPS